VKRGKTSPCVLVFNQNFFQVLRQSRLAESLSRAIADLGEAMRANAQAVATAQSAVE